MSDNLPDRVLGDLSGQAALFEDPLQLLGLEDTQFVDLVAAVRQEGESVIRAVRRIIGLLAWAAWHRYDERRYREFVADFATRLGVEPRAVLDWRRAVTKKGNLPMPKVAALRSEARKGARRGTSNTEPVLIPAASTEAPAKKSEGARVTPPRTGKGASSAPSLAPSDPSSEQLRSGPGGVVAPAGATPPEPPILSINGEVPEPLLVTDADGLRWLRSKSEAAIRSMGDPWRPAIQSEVERWALAMGLMRPKEPTTTRRAVGRMGLSGNLRVKPEVTKRPHDPTCSCLGCKPAKVAK